MYQQALSRTVQSFIDDPRFARALSGSNHCVEQLALSENDESFHLPVETSARNDFFRSLDKNVREAFGIGSTRPEIAVVFRSYMQKVRL